MRFRTFVVALLAAIILGPAIMWAPGQPREATAAPAMAVTLQSSFRIESMRVMVNGQYQGMLGPSSSKALFVNPGAYIRVVPDISPGCGFTAWQPGTYEIYSPCGLGQICPAGWRYLGP